MFPCCHTLAELLGSYDDGLKGQPDHLPLAVTSQRCHKDNLMVTWSQLETTRKAEVMNRPVIAAADSSYDQANAYTSAMLCKRAILYLV
jgi:hypothetical protein